MEIKMLFFLNKFVFCLGFKGLIFVCSVVVCGRLVTYGATIFCAK